MKQIIEYMGNTIVAVMVAGGIMGLFSGLPIELGKVAEQTLITSSMNTEENQAFIDYQTTHRNTIRLKEYYVIRTETTYEVDEFFTGASGEMNIDIWFVAGWHERLPDVKIQIMENGKRFSFSEPGIYQVLVAYKDSENVIHEIQVRLVVNEEATV